jgi:CheY-like chemotaxis protein
VLRLSEQTQIQLNRIASTSSQEVRPLKPEVLLVEDERMLAHMLSGMLRDEGYRVTCATSAEEAVACIINPDSKFSVLVADVNLSSSVSGVEVAQLLRQHDQNAVTVLMTGAATKQVRAEAPVGSIVLEKPFRHSELLDALDQLLA